VIDGARRVALVTGASRGIGRSSALALAARGFDVAVTARTVREGEGRAGPSSVREAPTEIVVPGSLETTAAEIRARGVDALAVTMDLRERASVIAAVDAVLDAWGRVDAVVNNAIYQGPGAMDRLLDLPLDAAREFVEGNYLTQLALVQHLLPRMLEQSPRDDLGTRGVIVNMTSATAVINPPAPAGEGGWGLAYAASKAAFTRMVGILHAEHGDDGIRAFNVDPGHVVTEAQRVRTSAKAFEDVGFRGLPPEVPGAVVAWLACADADAVALAGQTVGAAGECKRRALLPGWP
jgi:NAD(P)-dependent dehydrogenase (short-subunit alcohol dehydrogenase family)